MAEYRKLTNDEYHDDPAYGSSALEDFRKSRRMFYGMYVSREIPRRPATPAMDFGTLIHWRLLEPLKLTTHVNVVPDKAPDGLAWNMRRPDHRKAREAFEKKCKEAKCLCVDKATFDSVEKIAQGVESNKLAAKILSQPGEPEYSIFWTDEETGLNLKIRVDWFAQVCLDLKSTCDPSPEPYAKQCHKLGYHRKFAHYSAGLRAYCGEKREFVHLAIGTTKPYTVGQYNLMDKDRNGYSLGQGQRRRTLYTLAECLKTGDWREPYEKGIVDLELPSYAYSEDAYTL